MAHLLTVRRKIIFFALASLLAALAIIWRFYTIQITRHAELLKKAQNSYTKTEVIKNQRGKIFDFDGNLLAGNLPRIHIICSPYSAIYDPFSHLEKSLKAGVKESLPARREERRKILAQAISDHFGGTPEENYALLAPYVVRRDSKKRIIRDDNGKIKFRRNHYVRIAKAATPEQVEAFQEDLRSRKISPRTGFDYKDIFIRHYPKGRLLANVLGYANVSADGTEELGGLEKKIGKLMRSRDEVIRYEKKLQGAPLGYGEAETDQKGYDGKDIYLTVHEQIQAILEEELDAAMEEFNVKRIYAVIADPRTGNILGISQRPNFDPADPENFTDDMMSLKLAVNGYEPGSVMKPFTVGKALDWGIITPETIIDCSKWSYIGRPLSDAVVYGKMTPGGVLKKSSNIGTAKIALMLGEQRAEQVFKSFKFGQRTGLPFARETRGIVPKYPFPDRLMVTRAPIGYAIQVSILQLVRAYCALANGGWMPELRIIDRYMDPQTGIVTREKIKSPVQTFENQTALKELVEMLISVTAKDGTGRRAAIPGYEVAGKTGTSRKAVGGSYADRLYCASFAGFVPARNPQLVMVVTFDEISGQFHSGGNVAAPTFRKTMSRVLQALNVPPDFPEQLENEKNH